MSKESPEFNVCFPLPTDNIGISYTALSIYNEMSKRFKKVNLITPVVRGNIHLENVKQTVPWPLRFLPWRYLVKIAGVTYRRELLRRRANSGIYDFWSDNPVSLLQELRASNQFIVKEKFNCSQQIAYNIMRHEYGMLGAKYTYQVNEQSINKEMQEFAIANCITSPSPKVKESLLAIGVDEKKIVETSFGWEDSGNIQNTTYLSKFPHPRFLFVGSLNVRKGVHLLLDYWKKAQVGGSLIFLGQIQSEMLDIINNYKELSNIHFLGHIEKAFGIFEECDVFCFPTLEEGGPLVTYEALSKGIPAIVSPMGAGAILRDGVEGIMVDPHNEDGWVKGLRILSSDADLRRKYSQNGKIRAEGFLWEKVAEQRYCEIVRRYYQVNVV